MAIDELFQEETDKVLDDRVSRPLQAPTVRPSFGASVWGTMTALPRAAATTANEAAGFVSDIIGTFGAVQAGIGLQADPSNLFSQDEQKKRIAAGQKSRDELQSGEAFSTELGTGFRATARSFAPDPATASTAEQLLFGLGRFGFKAIGYSMLAGPAGPILTGTDEGMTEADRLKAEGVDFETRTKVGAVSGLSAAAATALPVAGTTFRSTAALVVAGGPASFVAQQAASRAILENAGYDKLGEQYDPFDPVGLAVSTLVPAGFGAWALRGARGSAKAPIPADPAASRALVDMAGNERLALKYDDPRLDAYAVTAAQREGIPPEALLAIKNVGEKSGTTAVSPKGAKGVMQFLDDTWQAYGKGDVRDPVAAIDAGARFMKDLIKQYDGDVRAAIAHYNGGVKAGKAVREGKAPPAAETRAYLERTDSYIAERQGAEVGKAMAQDPEAVAAVRVQQVREAIESTNLHVVEDVRGATDHLNAVLRAGDQLAAGERVEVSDLILPDRIDVARLQNDLVDHVTAHDFVTTQDRKSMNLANRMLSDLLADPDVPAEVRLRLQEASIKSLMKSENKAYVAAVEAARKIGELQPQTVDRIHQRIIETIRTEAPSSKPQEAAAKPASPAAKVATQQATPDAGLQIPGKASESGKPSGATSPADAPPAKSQGTAAKSADAGTNPIAASLDSQAAEIAKLSPDLMVQLEGMDAPMRLADALEAVKAEAAKEVQDAPLLQVAAECFLRSS